MAKHRLIIFSVLILAFVTSSIAQAPPAPPKPGPEHKKLEVFVGKWSLESNVKASPFGPAGKNTGTEVAELGPGGFTIILHDDVKATGGMVKAVSILGYDPQAKNYTYYGVDSMGMVGSGKGTVTGNAWNWTTETKMAGKIVKGRVAIAVTSPTEYTFKFELADDKGAYSTIEEGKATKAK